MAALVQSGPDLAALWHLSAAARSIRVSNPSVADVKRAEAALEIGRRLGADKGRGEWRGPSSPGREGPGGGRSRRRGGGGDPPPSSECDADVDLICAATMRSSRFMALARGVSHPETVLCGVGLASLPSTQMYCTLHTQPSSRQRVQTKLVIMLLTVLILWGNSRWRCHDALGGGTNTPQSCKLDDSGRRVSR